MQTVFERLGTSDLSRGHLHHLPRLLHRGVWALGSVFHNNGVSRESRRQEHKVISSSSTEKYKAPNQDKTTLLSRATC